MSMFPQNADKTLPLLFGPYAERYSSRPGGYTRIHKFGHRKGDHAPHAILELCDNPRDIKFELTARAVGRQTVQRWLKTRGTAQADNSGEYGTLADRPWIRDITKVNYTQLMKFASDERKLEFENKAIDWAVSKTQFSQNPIPDVAPQESSFSRGGSRGWPAPTR